MTLQEIGENVNVSKYELRKAMFLTAELGRGDWLTKETTIEDLQTAIQNALAALINIK